METHSDTDESDTHESRMLLRQASKLPQDPVCEDLSRDKPSYNRIHVRVVLCSVSMLFFVSSIPSASMLPQYLFSRMSREQNFNGSSLDDNQCNSDNNDSNMAQADRIEAEVSTMVMIYGYCSSVPGLFAGLIIGAYSDYIGRRFTLMTPILGMTIKFLIFAIIIKFNLDYWVFYIGFVIEGLTGTGFVALLAMFTITADSSSGKNDRILWITIVMSLGSIIAACSSIVCGYMIREVGYFPTAILFMTSMMLAFLVPLLLLPETKPHQEVRVLNLYQNVKRVFGFFLFDGTVKLKLTFWILLLMFFFAIMNEVGVGTIDTLYQLHRPFCWSSKMIGYYSALRIGGSSLLAMFLMGALQRCFRAEYIGMISAVIQGGSYCLEAFVKTNWQFFIVPVVSAPGCLVSSVIRGMMSLLAGPEKQGALFTSICVFEVACYMAASTIFNKVFAATVSQFPGAVYLCMASFSIIVCMLLMLYLKVHKDYGKPVDITIIVNKHE